jgi:hypothetical protein
MIRTEVYERDLDWCDYLGIDPMKACSGCKGCLTPTARDDCCNGTRQIPRTIVDIMNIYHIRIIDHAVGISKSLGANSNSMHARMHDAKRTVWK